MENIFGENKYQTSSDVATDTASTPRIIQPLTELGNATLFLALFSGLVRYVTEQRKWIVFNGQHWTTCPEMLMKFSKSLIKVRYSEARSRRNLETSEGEPVKHDAVLKWAKKTSFKRSINGFLDLAKDLPGIRISQAMLDANPHLLGAPGGVIELVTGEFRPGRPEDLVSRVIGTRYNPNAKCPTFLRFLDDITLDRKDLAQFFQEVFGYFLSGLTTEHAFFIFLGKGANGKSTIVELFTKLMGDYAVGMPGHAFVASESRAIRNDLARLVGKRFASAVEVNTGRKLDESTVKRITGGDTLTARFLREEFFDFSPLAKFVFGVNTVPTVTGADEGIYRRLRIVPFDADFRKQIDKKLPEKLAGELEGVLMWALKGFQRYHERGGLEYPTCVVDAGLAYRDEMDGIGAFIAEMCTVDPAHSVPLGAIYNAYTEWAVNACIDPVKKHMFSTLMMQKGFPKKHSGERKWLGIKLKDSPKSGGTIVGLAPNTQKK